MTQAELWDRRFERVDWLIASHYQGLEDVIYIDKAYDLLREMREAVVHDAVGCEWQTADRVLTFADTSKLLLIAPGADTAAGSSRVLRSTDQVQTRMQVRDGSPYRHGITHDAWLAFPPHDSF